jgi:HK97 family phage major capsid protein
MSKYADELKARRKAKVAEMSRVLGDGHGSFPRLERERFDDLKADIDGLDARIAGTKGTDLRGEMGGIPGRKPWKGDKRIEGRAYEPLGADQSMTGWYRKAQENNIQVPAGTGYGRETVSIRAQGTERDLNAYWGERISSTLRASGHAGWAKPTVESRALGEDTAGSGQAIAPQSWTPEFIDVLLPNTILGTVGAVKVPMATEYYNYPVYTSTVSPSWIGEGGSISLDANPAFSPLQLIANRRFQRHYPVQY